MSTKDEIMLEELLLGFLRSSPKIKLSTFQEEDGSVNKKYTLVFDVDKDFGSTLINSLDNTFASFFEKNK